MYNVHEYIKKKRVEAGLTQREFANRVGTSITTVQNWEKDTLPSDLYWDKIVKELNIDSSLFGSLLLLTKVRGENEKEFPVFLFPEELKDYVCGLSFSADEQRLFEIELFYGVVKRGELFPHRKNAELTKIPSAYVVLTGPERINGLHDSLYKKLTCAGNITVSCFVVSYIQDYIRKYLCSAFSIFDIEPQGLYDFANAIYSLTTINGINEIRLKNRETNKEDLKAVFNLCLSADSEKNDCAGFEFPENNLKAKMFVPASAARNANKKRRLSDDGKAFVEWIRKNKINLEGGAGNE